MYLNAKVNVLLVEDSPTDVLLAREVVDSYPQFRLRHVERLGEAIRLLSGGHFDVVLLDLGLPDSQGLDTLVDLLRANPDMPVVVMTARDDEELALKAVNAGAQDYLVKSHVVNGMLGRAICYAIERRHAETARRERAALAALGADVGLSFTTGGTLPEMLQHCAESLVRNLGEVFTRIWSFNQAEMALDLQARAGLPNAVNDLPVRVPLGTHRCGLIAQEKQPYLNNNVTSDPDFSDPEWGQQAELPAFVGYPLMVEDHLVGVVEIFSRTPFSASVLQSLNSLANQIAVGIERKLQQETLREREERFQELTVHIDQALWMIDVRQARVLYVSAGYEKLWGRTCQSLLDDPESYMEGIHPLDRERIRRENAAMYQTGHIDMECRVVRPDGSVVWIWVRGYPVREQGQLVRVVGVVEDVTQRRKLAAERDALLARLQLYIKRLPLAYVLFDADLCIVDWNPTAERIFGFTREQMLGKAPPYEQIVPRSFYQAAEVIRRRIRAGDMDAHSINENLTQDGRTISCQWYNTPLLEEDGRFVGMLSLAEDVTERLLLEEKFRQAQKMEAIGQLAGGVAHDFNNLLTIINGYSELIHNHTEASGSVRGLAAEIGHAGARAAALTQQLLVFSRKQILEPKVLNLNGIVTDTERMLRRLIGEDIRVSVVLDPELGLVNADPGQIEQVLMNLAVNARDAMPQGGMLTIETSNTELDESYTQGYPELRPGHYVRIAVTDTGSGMDEFTKIRIFEPFFTTKESGKGTGLGLATVFGIVKQSEGHVAVYSELGHGTTFKVYLPQIKAASQPGIPLARTGGSVRGTETILFADDEPALRTLTRLILTMHGYTVLEAEDGESALRLAREFEGTIDLLVTDVVMPGMSGRLLAERLVQVRPTLKVLYLSGYTDDAVVRHGILQAETAFLQKPFTPDLLAKKVREVLDRLR